jgi:probable rRNA maturation factor
VADDSEHPTVLVSNRQAMPVDETGLTLLAQETLRAEGVAAGELSISFVSEEEIADLHVRYLGEEGPTDVLSFPQDEPGDRPRGRGRASAGDRLLGDVVIAPAFAARAAAGPEDALERELRLLVVHGVLHLLGYDHEEEDERVVMWQRQESYCGVRA